MRPNLFVILPVALLMAGGVGLAVSHYVSGIEKSVHVEPVKKVEVPYRVLVMAKTVNIGNTISMNDIKWVDWPDNMIDSIRTMGAISTKNKNDEGVILNAVAGSLARVKLSQGEIFIPSKVIMSNEKGSNLSFALRPGYRAFPIPMNPMSSSGNMIEPGDRVDLVLATDSGLAKQYQGKLTTTGQQVPGRVTETIMTDLKVLTVDHNFYASRGQHPDGHFIMVEVTPRQLDKLILAQGRGQIYTVVRPYEKGKKKEKPVGLVADVQVTPELRATLLHKDVDEVKKIDPFVVVPDTSTPKMRNISVYEGANSVKNVQVENGEVVMGETDGITVIHGPVVPHPEPKPDTQPKPQQNAPAPKPETKKEPEVPYVPYISPAMRQQIIHGGR